MSNTFKDDLYTALEGHGVTYLNVNRDSSVKGSPATQIEIFTAGSGDLHARHLFTFDKSNHMTVEHMAEVIKSYLRNRT